MRFKLLRRSLAVTAFLALFLPCQAQDKTIEQDTDKDGKVDRITRLGEDGKIAVLEIDSNGDGVMDRFQYYENEEIVRLESDSDHNGKVLRLKEVDKNGDGKIDLREHYDERGNLTRSDERFESTDHLDIAWFYDEEGEAFRAERDRDGDSRPDMWLYYEKGRLIRLEDDTDGDGKPDLWEEYDRSETLLKRSRDFNRDGVPDLVEENRR